MGAGDLFGMEPPVAAICGFEGEFIVLNIIFAYIDIKSVAGEIVERFGGYLFLATVLALGMSFNIT